MRLSNKTKRGYYNLMCIFTLVISALGISAFIVEYFIYDFLGSEQWLLLIIPLGLSFLLYCRGRQIFEYDSEGEALNFTNKNALLFVNKSIYDEFPKYKLIDYEFINMIILKNLYITINNKKGKHITLKYDISYLTKKEVSDLNISLCKITRFNKEKRARALLENLKTESLILES